MRHKTKLALLFTEQELSKSDFNVQNEHFPIMNAHLQGVYYSDIELCLQFRFYTVLLAALLFWKYYTYSGITLRSIIGHPSRPILY